MFFHISSVDKKEQDRLQKGQQVSYEIEETDRGKVAINLSIEKSAQEPKEEQDKKATGVIKFYNADKRFGFISQEKGADLFFHISSVIEKPTNINRGQRARYEISQTDKGPQARKVVIRKDLGKLYMDKQISDKTPMVFETYAQSIPCVVKENLTYDIDLLCDDEVQRIKKTDVKYCYKQEYEDSVKENVQFDQKIVSLELEPILPPKDRYKINNNLLKNAEKEKKKIRLLLRGGEIIVGTVRWFSPYEIKVKFPGGNLIAFRHAAYDFGIVGEDVKNESVYINPNSTTYHRPGCHYLGKDAVSIEKSEAEERGLEPCGVCALPS